MKVKTPALIATLFFIAFSSAIAQTTAVRDPAPAPAAHATAIPVDQIGTVAGKQYSGDGLAVTASADGARLRCVFQRLDGHVTADGLWLISTKDGTKGEPFRVIASAIGRAGTEALPGSGNVQVSGQTVRFIRSGVTEEYSVSIDGLQQDFVIAQRPRSDGPLRLELDVAGAKAEAMPGGARLVLADGGRKMVYDRLTAKDANGKELEVRLEIVASNRLAVVLDDVGAQYPVRIDPTFSDANWISFGGFPGVDGEVDASVVDSTGNLYVGGNFSIAGDVLASDVARWNGSSWSALGSGAFSGVVGPTVDALAILGTNLIAGGSFTTAGGVGATNIAQWNGSSWSALGSGLSLDEDGYDFAYVNTLAVSGNSLFAGGSFTMAGGVAATNIAEWNGSSWSTLNSGMNGGVSSLAVSGNILYAGGQFTTAGGATANYIAQWNGISWSALGSGISGTEFEGSYGYGPYVNALAVLGTNLFVGGVFTTAGGIGAADIAEWNGTSWSGLGTGISGVAEDGNGPFVYALAVSGNNLFVGGDYSKAGPVTVNGIAQWNGNSWSGLGDVGLSAGSDGAGPYVDALAVSGNNLFVGGDFTNAGPVSANNIAQWNGSSWSPLSSGMNYTVQTLAVLGNNLFAGGYFTTTASGSPVNYIAQFNLGNSWSALGSGMNNVVEALAVSTNTLYAAGKFTTVGGVTANNIAQWNGSSWSALGSGTLFDGNPGTIYALAVMGTNLFAGGQFSTAGGVPAWAIAQWNGNSWSALGSGLDADQVNALAVSGTNLFVGCSSLTSAGGVFTGGIVEWNGISWSALGSGLTWNGNSYDSQVYSLVASGTNLFAGGSFTSAGGLASTNIAKWNGTTWSALGSVIEETFTGGYVGWVSSLAVSGTNLFAGGFFATANGMPANNIAQWNGSTWSALGSGISGNDVYALAVSGTNLFAGGNFSSAGGSAASGIAEWNGHTWSALGSGVNGNVYALAVSGNNLFVGGSFSTAGTNVSAFIAEAASIPPGIQFTASPTKGAEPLAVQFNCPPMDSVSNAIAGWNWSFGDGSTSTNQNPLHTYITPGTFNPGLVATSAFGYEISASGSSITVTSAPPIKFTAVPTNGAAPLTVQLNSPAVDTLGYPIVSWNWSFGDGSTSTNQNPLHTYITTGVFTPALMVTNSPGAEIAGIGPSITVTSTPPVISFSPLTNGEQVANLANIGGFVSFNFSLAATANFSIHELDINGGPGRWWNGTNFLSVSNSMPAAITGTNWARALADVLPQLNSGLSYQLFVTVTNASSRASATITVQAPITLLTWDPGVTSLGTEVLNAPNTNGGNYLFEIIPQTPAYGVWRTALNVLAGQAGLYMQEGSPQNIYSYAPWVSDRAGSNGFVLDASQFNAGQPWYILVNATTNASWNLVTGDIFVYNLGSLAADNSSSTNVSMGAEGMAFFKTTVPPSTLAWQLWLDGLATNLCVKRSSAPDVLADDYDLNQIGQMLVVPPYLDGQTYDGYYFVSVPALPGTSVNLDSRQQPIASVPFGSSTNVSVGSGSFPYVTYQIQVPAQPIAWQLNLSPSNGAPAIAARLAQVPNEFNNDAYSDVGGGIGNSITLVPSSGGTGSAGLSAGTYYVTVYGAGSFSCGFTNGDPVITPVCFFFDVTNDVQDQGRVGWRYYSVLDINSQLGSLGWELILSNAPAGSQIAVRRTAVPGEWNYRDYEYDNNYIPNEITYADQWSIDNVLQQPRHEADIWYIGVYSPTSALGNFVLTGQQFNPQPIGFDTSGNSINVTNQPVGWWNFFKVIVPPDTNLLGWDLRLTNVTQGYPQLVVCQDELASGLSTYGPDWPLEDWPWAATSWSDGDEWEGGMDWTGEPDNPNGFYANVNMLEMGMGNPLQPGTYYVGIYDNESGVPDTYTLESRGIGISNYSIPVSPLNWTNGVVTNTLAPREAAYYSVVIPTNAPGWHVLLTPTNGQAILLAQENYLPNVGAESYGSAAYPVSEEYDVDPSGGIKMEKLGNEHYLLLPPNGQSSIPAGTYYLGVVSEGVNPVMGSEIGSNGTTCVLQSLGPLPIINLGVAGTNDLIITNSLAGGDVAAYQFIFPSGLWSNTNRVDGFITLTNVTQGAPTMSVVQGTNIPSTSSGYGQYGEDGGASGAYPSGASTDPTPGIYTLAIQQTSPYSDTSYTLDIHLRFTGSTPMSYDSAGNSMSVTNQPAGWWRYFTVVVPSDTNLLGWDLRLTNVTSGYPQLVVRKGELPLSPGTSGLDWPDEGRPQAGTTWSEGDQWDGEMDWTGEPYNPNGSYADVNMLEMGMGNPLEPGTYYVGVYDEYGDYADSYTLESRGIGITNFSIPVLPLNWSVGSVTNTLAPREAAYYSVVIPTNTPSWHVLLTPTNGQAILLAQKNYLPNVGAEPDGSAAYPAEEVNPPTGGIKIEKSGNEHYLLLPQSGQNSIPAGTYYLGVVSEGVNPVMGSEIGSNATTYVLQSLGPLPVINLGVAGTNDLIITNSLLAGGDVAAYQFTLPPGLSSETNRLDMFVTFTNVTQGAPTMSMIQGTNIPSTFGYAQYGEDGGVGPGWSGYGPINPSADPNPGIYTLAVQQTYPYSDTSYAVDVHLRFTGFEPMSCDGTGNSMSVTNQPAGWWRYFQVVVPSDTNLLGWDLRLTNVTSGYPQLVVCSGELPLSSGTFGPDWPYESMPWGGITWSEGDQWNGEIDWTSESYNPDGSYVDVSMLEMGMGNPLEPGTYYVGVYDEYGEYADSYTLESRGIGITNYSIPVLPLNWTNGVVTNTLAPREAAYYSVLIPTNTPSWHVQLAPATGDAILLAQENYLPNVRAAAGGSAAYPAEYSLDPSGGIKMQKTGNEHYLLLPQDGQSSIPAGTYYLGVVSEGVNSDIGYEIGSNATTYVLQSPGPLPITNLGTVGSSDLEATNALLEGGDFSAYQFAIPTNIIGVELSLQGVVGNPAMSLAESSLLPAPYYPYSYYDSYVSSDGGQNDSGSGVNLITLRNPDSGTYSLLINAATDASGLTPDASYTLQVMPLPTPLLNIDALLNTNGGANLATGTLADTESAFFEVIVPATVDGAPVLGWNLDLSESSGSARVRVRPNALPDNTCDTTSFASGSIVVAPPYLAPGTWYVEVNASGSTTFTLTSSVITTNTLTRNPWVMPTTAQTNTSPGLVLPEFGDTGVDTNGAALSGDQGVNLAQGQYDFYAIVVPTNNAGLLRTELQAISGNPSLYIRVGAMPTVNHYASGSCYDGSSLVDRQLTGGNTEYGNWVPLNGQTTTNLTPGLWFMSVYASGTDARYRLQLSCGTPITNLPSQTMAQGGMCLGGSMTNGTTAGFVQILPLNGSVTYTNQQLAGGDWRYYLAQIPSNAPNDWVVTWTAAQGSPHLFIRDTVPPGDAANTLDYNLSPGAAMSWSTDAKNEGPYPDFALPGSDILSTPPLRPGAAYYLGFWSPDDATFSVTCITNAGYIDITNVITFYQGQIAGTIPPHGCIEYQVNLPTTAPGIVLNATNSSNVILTLEQGTVAIPGGPAHWTSSSTNSSLNEPFYGAWPWLQGYTYYLTVTNDSAVTGTFELTTPALAPLQPVITGLNLSAGNLVISATSGASGATYNLLMATNLAQPIGEWASVGSNTLTASGNFSITVTNATAAPQRFYILQKR